MSSAAEQGFVDRLGLALLALLVGAPIVFSLLYALLYSFGLAGLLDRGPTLEHWAEVLGSVEIRGALGLSLGVAAVTVVLTTVLSLMLALGLGRSIDRGALSFALYLPLALPGAVAAFLALQLLSGGGLLARFLTALGWLERPSAMPPLVHDRWAVAIIATHVALAVPFFTLLFRALHASERVEELARLARSLGASRWQALRRVTLPVLLRRSTSNLVLFFVVVLGSFEIPLLLGRQTPEMLSVLTFRKFALYDLGQKPEAYVVALLYSAVVFALLGLIAGSRRRDEA